MRVKGKHILFGILAITIATALLEKRRVEDPGLAPARSGTATFKKAGPSWAYPDPSRTPGVTNHDVTQANIAETICNPNWSTKSIRPPESYTYRLKRQQMAEWGLPGKAADYEEDHFISLELGGSPKDPKNLWPEPYDPEPGAKEKDVVENYLHRLVCTGSMTLQEAQYAIVTDWYKVYLQARP